MTVTDVMLELIEEAERKCSLYLPYMALLGRGDVDWRAVNGAIIERWSKVALEEIKTAAWAMAESAVDLQMLCDSCPVCGSGEAHGAAGADDEVQL